MNEVENHYAGTGRGGRNRQPARGPAGGSRVGSSSGGVASGIAGTVKSTAEDVLDTASDAYGRAADWGRGTYRGASSWASDRYGSARQHSNRTRRTVTDFVEENPVMVGVVGIAAGLLIGALLPGTTRENRTFGRYADEVREQGFRYAQDLAQQGKSLVEEGLQAAAAAAPRGDRDTGDETRAS